MNLFGGHLEPCCAQFGHMLASLLVPTLFGVHFIEVGLADQVYWPHPKRPKDCKDDES